MKQARTIPIIFLLAAALLAGAASAETYDAWGAPSAWATISTSTTVVLPVQSTAFVSAFKAPEIRHRTVRSAGRSNTNGRVLVRVDPKLSSVDPFRFNR